MGRKRKKNRQTSVWCFYCDRIFNDEGTLIGHQRTKHFRCSMCGKKMNTAHGLQVHCEHVHKVRLNGYVIIIVIYILLIF